MKEDDAMTIREMCDMFDVTARTLRFYEAKELLSPIREGQKRLYTRRERARLKLILRGKRFGLSLESIRQTLDLYEMGDQGYTQLVRSLELAKERRIEMAKQRDELNIALEELSDMIEWAEKEVKRRSDKNTSAA